MKTITLQYGRSRNRQWLRLTLLGMALALITHAVIRIGILPAWGRYQRWVAYRAAVARQVEYIRLQDKARNFDPPAYLAALETYSVEAKQLLDGGGDYLAVEKCWDRDDRPAALYHPAILSQIDVSYQSGLLFLHERAKPNGAKRLVSLMFEISRTPEALTLSFQGRADSLASAAPYSCRTPIEWGPNYSFKLARNKSIRLLFGRPDAADPCRFSVSYEYEGKGNCLQFVVTQNGVQLVDGDFLLRYFD